MDTISKKGRLFIVSTPIGNLDDLSPRARDCLAGVCIVACEDTRRTGLLLSRLGLKKKLISYHNANERERSSILLDHLLSGCDIAVVSDAGTPGISDPAYHIVRSSVAAGIDIFSIPGPSSVLAALVVSGLPLDRFVFEGFLPQKGSARTKRLEILKHETRTIVIFESPYRIIRLLDSIFSVFGDREISVSRELTKLYEETVHGVASAVLEVLKKKKPRGEYTVVIRGFDNKEGI